ncbi:hypothetical protein OSTOST_25623, partial [Ostertagia ostertagi]
MSLFFYKKPKYESYGENVAYPENEEELYEKAIANVSLLSSALTRIKTAVSNLQEKIDKMENQFANAKKADQKDMMIEVQEMEKESQYSQHLSNAEIFIHTLESQLTEARVNLAKAQRKLKLPSSRDITEGDATQSTNGVNWSHTTSEDELLKVLEKEISSKLFVETHWGSNSEHAKESKLTRDFKVQNQRYPQTCVFCERNNHFSAACRTVSDVQRRRDIVREKHLCWKCFYNNHSSTQCKKPNCSNCGQKHHVTLCLANRPSSNIARPPPHNQRWAKNENSQQDNTSRPQRFDNRVNNRASNDARRAQQTNTQLVQNEQEHDRSSMF